jgi:hypothetical protein
MIHRIRWGVAILGIAALTYAAALLPRAEATPLAFALGESLTYAVKWGPVRAGTAVMSVRDTVGVESRTCYHIVSEAESNSLFSVFYPVEDRIETWMDVEKLVPLRHVKRLREGTYAQDESMRFDHERGMAQYSDGEWVAFAPGVQDFLSALYYVRCLDLSRGGPIYVENQTNKKNYRLEVRTLGQERIDTPAGSYDCTLIEPVLPTTALFKQEGRLWIWLSNDARHLPVMMKSRIKVGSITAVLEEVVPGRSPAGVGEEE